MTFEMVFVEGNVVKKKKKRVTEIRYENRRIHSTDQSNNTINFFFILLWHHLNLSISQLSDEGAMAHGLLEAAPDLTAMN